MQGETLNGMIENLKRKKAISGGSECEFHRMKISKLIE